MVDDIRPKPSGRGSDDEDKNGLEQQFPGIKPDTREEVADISIVDDDSGSIRVPSKKYQPPVEKKSDKNKSWRDKFFQKGLTLWPHTEKQKKIGIAVIAVLLVFGSISVYALNKALQKPFEISNAKIIPRETNKNTEPSRLTGVEISKKLNKRHLTSIQIENSPDARPQSGLYDAGVVFEAIAEGGITRFNAIFLETRPDYIGPIRSVRPYYVDLMLPFDPSFVHAGGSVAGLAQVAKWKVKDIDFGANGDAFRRVSSRYAPHNLYSSMDDLDRVSKRRGYDKSTFVSWPRLLKEAPADKVTADKINFYISGPLYDVQYNYDSKTNSYARIMAGQPHKDEKAKKQIKPKVVIALIMDYHKAGIYSVYTMHGSGSMFVFQNGEVIKGKWTKTGPKGQLKFLTKDGKVIRLNPGKTWVTLLKSSGEVKYQP